MELWQVLLDGVAQGELSLFGQHHNADGGNGLGHGHDLEDSVLPHGTARLDVRHAKGMALDDLVPVSNERDGARDGSVVDKVFHALWDLGKNCVVYARSLGGLFR